MLATSMLVGCDSDSRQSQSAEVDLPSQARPRNPDLLSTDGELFPLSAYYGVCTRYKGIWRTTFHSGPLNPHEPTGGEITAAGGINLKISVGKFGLFSGLSPNMACMVNMLSPDQARELEHMAALRARGMEIHPPVAL